MQVRPPFSSDSTQTFIVTVAFTVQAARLGPWSPEQCALDFIRHRIDEGLPIAEHIKDWDFVDVASPVDFNPLPQNPL